MKKILFVSALALSTAAFAQPGPGTNAPASTMSAAPDATPPSTSATPTPDASTAQPAMPPSAPATPDAAAPAATPPATGAGMGNADTTTSAASSTDDSNLPVCSKTVTDKCKQGAGAHHGTAHHMTHKKK